MRRVRLVILGRVIAELVTDEPEPDPDDTQPLDSAAVLYDGPEPFGFRPSPDPWPPSWE